MTQGWNIYCDESCHLEHDCQNAMVLGALWCPIGETRRIAERVREIKVRHGLRPEFEIKWTKVSPAKVEFYLDVLGYFFDDPDLRFRAVVVPDKSALDHEQFHQEHDDWHYKIYYVLLKALVKPGAEYRIYVDYKDTLAAAKLVTLEGFLRGYMGDYSPEFQAITRIQSVRSHEVEQVQLADLLIGAVSYANRALTTSGAKLKLVEEMRRRAGHDLTRTTYGDGKVDLLRWQADEGL